MKTRFGRTLLTLLMVAFAATPVLAQQGLYCANPGVNTNTGATTSSWRCGYRILQRGTGTLTFNATSTVTGSAGAFAGVVPPAAVGGPGVFFNASGLHFVFGGRGYFYRISAKASDTSVTVLAGAAAPAQSGTTTEWWYWNTTCYQSATAFGVFTDANTITDRRLWETHSGLKFGAGGDDSQYRPLADFNYRPAAGVVMVSNVQTSWRPAGVPIIPTVLYASGDAATTAESVSYRNVVWAHFIGAELNSSIQSTTADNFIVPCIWRGRP